jgi:hypothetical protein
MAKVSSSLHLKQTSLLTVTFQRLRLHIDKDKALRGRDDDPENMVYGYDH